jgi:hypothetical protein
MILVAATVLGLNGLTAWASPLMPSLADAPTGWVTDRYDPASFGNVGTYQGRDDVLGISISAAQAYDNRPAPYQNTFYNTQGRQHAISGGMGDYIAADLFIESSWASSTAGSVRTDMWGVMTDGSAVSAYPIIGFTNYGGSARYRVWDSTNGVWIDLATTVQFGAWVSLEILFTGSSFDYFINGVDVFSDKNIDGTSGFAAVIMQAYNFGGDPSIAGAVASNYTAHWSDAAAAAVPEPATLALVPLALLGALLAKRRKA